LAGFLVQFFRSPGQLVVNPRLPSAAPLYSPRLRAFLWIVNPKNVRITITKLDDLATVTDLKSYARRDLANMSTLLNGLAEAR
jgi:hypothetical protein